MSVLSLPRFAAPRFALPRAGSTREALTGLGTSVTAAPAQPSAAQAVVDTVTSWLSHRTSRRGLLVKAGVVGTALAVDPFGYVLRPGTAYAAVCGPGASCTSGWTAFCATINKGVNTCPPGSVAAGWWKSDGANLCGGKARYIIDCNATCSRCTTPGSRAGICSPSCWSCTCTCGPSGSCDRRKVCCNSFRYGQCNTQIRQVGAVQCRVVSCTPPWLYGSCSSSPATDNRTKDHNSSELPQAFTAISRRYVALHENWSVLGPSVYGEFAVKGGTAQRYVNGRITSTARGTWETVGAIGRRYVGIGAETSALGPPISGYDLKPGGGASTRFVGGRISTRPTTGTWETFGAIATRYQLLGGENHVIGYPIGPQQDVTAGGRATPFENGRISFAPSLGAWETVGPISRMYAQLGNETGRLGFPVNGNVRTPDLEGRYTPFQFGRISWHPRTNVYWAGKAIADEFVRRGAERGELGYPVSSQAAVPGSPTGAVFVRYQRGTLTHDPVTGIVTRT